MHFFKLTCQDGNLALDQHAVLLSASRLLHAMVDVISSNGFGLKLALLAMEVSQMVTQGLWEFDSMLLQLPHFTKELANRCQEHPKKIETVFDLVEMEDNERKELMQMSDSQLLDNAKFCNHFPNIDISYEVLHDGENVNAGGTVTLLVILQRDQTPEGKEEGWWLVVGDTE